MGTAETQAAHMAGAARISADCRPHPPMAKGRQARPHASSDRGLPASHPQVSRTTASCSALLTAEASPSLSGYWLHAPAKILNRAAAI